MPLNMRIVFILLLYHGRLGLGLIEVLEVLAERGDDGLVAVGVLAENILDDHHSLLHHVIYLCLDQLQQHGNASLRRLLS